MDDLIVFLTARLDETEARALAAREDWDDESQQYEWNDLSEAVYAHARCLDPALVLREVEAKRKILAAHGPDLINRFGSARSPLCLVCLTDREGYEEQWEADPWPCLTLRALAAVYSDHPDYWPAAAGKDGKE